MSDYQPIHPQAVRALLGELLDALDTGGIVGTGHAVLALRRLTTGPVAAGSDLVAVTGILRAHLAEIPAAASTAPPEADPAAGPFTSRLQAEEVFAHVRRGAGSGAFGSTTQFLAEYLTDSIDSIEGAEVGPYDHMLITRIAGLFDAIDVAVIASWLYRVTHDRPDQATHIVNPDPEAGQWLP